MRYFDHLRKLLIVGLTVGILLCLARLLLEQVRLVLDAPLPPWWLSGVAALAIGFAYLGGMFMLKALRVPHYTSITIVAAVIGSLCGWWIGFFIGSFISSILTVTIAYLLGDLLFNSLLFRFRYRIVLAFFAVTLIVFIDRVIYSIQINELLKHL